MERERVRELSRVLVIETPKCRREIDHNSLETCQIVTYRKKSCHQGPRSSSNLSSDSIVRSCDIPAFTQPRHSQSKFRDAISCNDLRVRKRSFAVSHCVLRPSVVNLGQSCVYQCVRVIICDNNRFARRVSRISWSEEEVTR